MVAFTISKLIPVKIKAQTNNSGLSKILSKGKIANKNIVSNKAAKSRKNKTVNLLIEALEFNLITSTMVYRTHSRNLHKQ